MNPSKKIFSYIKITRPINVLITFIVVVVAILISAQHQIELTKIILVSLSAALIAAAGNIVNDIYDIETDKVSHPNRVLAQGLLSKKEAVFLYNFFNVIAIILASRISDYLIVIVLFTIILLYVYSAYLKKLPLVGNIVIAFITGLAFIYGGFAADNPNGAIVPAVFAFLINLIREIVKDIQDIEGDSKLSFKTFPILYGIKKSKIIILFFTILLTGFTFFPFITQLYKIEYFLIVMIFVNPLLVLSLKILFDMKKENRYKIVSNILKINMILGLIAIWFGR
ncbi:MAG TPA: geranylgeranylglycerol-phosphate geranylgeranyltransferase [Ignavibacteriaceae bacterium]|nr:geranylgeranylglycerol-phosphate geranylgeranyltransferase [Ignavibacteriaceae bacterium]